ncbi:MAG: molybdate ABC transporter permease subunit [Chloroflexi bacterium]|nr:molybdate ABC transporter permease subunit [Chloroflexota bacterium]MDA1174587.1 molybdate ABC transporter permease subunit [Chloroflexota bacterium]
MDWDALRISLQVALTSTVLATVVGVPFAWWLARSDFRGRNVVSALILAPMVLPPTVLGYYLLLAVGRRSVIGGFLDSAFSFSFVFDWTGAVLAAFVVSTPFLVRTAQAGFESVDTVYEEAARTLGRSEISVFLHVALPLARRSVLAGVALALARALGEFGATLMVAGNLPGRTQTMSIAIYDAVLAGRTSDARVLALTLTFVSVGLLVAVGAGAGGWRQRP